MKDNGYSSVAGCPTPSEFLHSQSCCSNYKLELPFTNKLIHDNILKHPFYGLQLDMARVTHWCSSGFYGPVDNCKVCGMLDDCNEVSLEWGDSGNMEYISEMCLGCTRKIWHECRNYVPGKRYD
jgi:hypothetical protein